MLLAAFAEPTTVSAPPTVILAGFVVATVGWLLFLVTVLLFGAKHRALLVFLGKRLLGGDPRQAMRDEANGTAKPGVSLADLIAQSSQAFREMSAQIGRLREALDRAEADTTALREEVADVKSDVENLKDECETKVKPRVSRVARRVIGIERAFGLTPRSADLLEEDQVG